MPSEWIPLAALKTPVLLQNLAYLRIIGSEVLPLLADADSSENLFFQNQDGIIRCRTGENPPQWLVGRSDPKAELEALRREMEGIPNDFTLLVMAGNRIGYSLAHLLPRLAENPDRRILVVEPSADRVLACFALVELHPALKSGRLHFSVSSITPDGLRDAVDQCNLWGFSNVVFHASPEIQSEIVAQDWVADYHRESERKAQQRLEVVERFSQVVRKKDRKIIKTILLIDFWTGAPGSAHLHALQRALKTFPVRTQLFPLNRYRIQDQGAEYRRLFEPQLLKVMESLQPDLILSYAHHAPQLVAQELYDSLKVTWLQAISTIAYFDTTFYAGEHTAVLEKHMIPNLQRWGAPHVFHIPIMADYVADQPTQTNGRLPIVFVGNSLGLSPEAVAQFFNRWAGRDALIRYLHEAEAALSRFDPSKHLYQYLNENPVPQITGEEEYFAVYRYLLCQASAARRCCLLEKIMPLGLHIFGGDWDNYLLPQSPLRACLRGYLPLPEEPKIFSQGVLFINIHSIGHVTGPNMRFFNVPGMGAFQLSDGPAFSEYLEPDRETVYYHTEKELIDRARFYLGHPKERDAIRFQGQKRVQRDWTYRQWIDRVCEQLGLSLPEP